MAHKENYEALRSSWWTSHIRRTLKLSLSPTLTKRFLLPKPVLHAPSTMAGAALATMSFLAQWTDIS